MQNLRVRRSCIALVFAVIGTMLSLFTGIARAQALSGKVQGTVVDPSGATIPNATVQIENPVSGYVRQAKTDTNGSFTFVNIPLNPYHLTVSAQGFANSSQDVDVKSSVPVVLMNIGLKLGSATTAVTVTENAADLLEVTPEEHTDVDRSLIEDLPLESHSSSVSSLITLASPGVSADSNGLFHGLGDHAENSFSVDGQPITDQQSKVFSNQIPVDSIQSLEVIEGAPPPEYGGKTSLVIVATTRSGLNVTTPHGEVTTSYGTFGTSSENANLAYGGAKWGDFVSLGGLNTGRFLDGPEVALMHDKGNEENTFNRFDYKVSDKDTLQLNFSYTRSWFQTPNSYDSQFHYCTVPAIETCNASGTFIVNPLTGNPLGPDDERSQIGTYLVSPSWTRLINANSVFDAGIWARRDQYNYYPSNDPLNSFIPDLTSEAIGQNRSLTNVGGRLGLSYVKGIHNVKLGVTFQHTFLNENDSLGIVDPGLLPGLGCPNPTIPQCAILAPYDLTTGGTPYLYTGHGDIKETALFGQDSVTLGSWSINYGLRVDFYNGVQAYASQVEPRGGVAYNIKKMGTVLRASYARTLESPFNENLVLSGTGCSNPVINAVMTVAEGFACTTAPLSPGFRNEFHAGLQQAFGKYFVLSGEYIWKYTHNAYDFNVLGFSPITFPIEWARSKIPGYAIKGTVPEIHGFTAFVVMSSVAARFYPPTVSGIAPAAPPGVFRIDHDELFNQTTHAQYQPFKRGPWFGFNWRYDSGLVAGPVPCAGGEDCLNGPAGTNSVVDTSGLTPDQQFVGGLFCGSVHATPFTPISSSLGPNLCPASQYGSNLVTVPAAGTENDDHNPPRIAPRNLFDLAIGQDDIFHTSERYKWSARFTILNVANTLALYNFLSTFSGTHYVSPRTFTGEIGFHF
jgi:hypothetical protein